MLAPAAEDIEVLVDAFKGEIVFLEEAADTLASIHGVQVKQQEPASLASDSQLDSVSVLVNAPNLMETGRSPRPTDL